MDGDNPALSLFKSVEQNSLQNQEEEENIEDIRQRQQEIQNFLTAVLDEYNYDESSCDETQKSYAENSNQLQFLYEMRCKEIGDLIVERDALKKTLEEERNVNENRKALSENLLEQCQVSVQQLQEVLVAKTEKINDYEQKLIELHGDFERKLKEIQELQNENAFLRGERDALNKKINQIELDSVSTNKITERELQNQYLQKISLLEKQLNDCAQEIGSLETSKYDLKDKIQNILREKNDLNLQNEKTIGDLKQNLDVLKAQNSFLLEELQKTKSDYSKYVEETKAAKQAFEKIKQQIAPSRLQEIDSTVSNLKRLLQEKDEEIADLTKVLHLTQTKSVKDVSIVTEPNDALKETLIALQSDFKNAKSDVQKITEQFSIELQEMRQKVSYLLRDLNYAVNGRDKLLVELRKVAINEIEKLRNDNATLSTVLRKINGNLNEAKDQAILLENRVKTAQFENKQLCNRETNTENENFLQKEIEFRDKIAKDFQEKLKNIEEKYKSAAQVKNNCNTLKQQIVELATKLHKYKTLYEESRKGMAEFLTIANDHIKNLETKVLAVERGRHHTQKEMDILKMLLEDKDCKLKELFLATKRQENEIVALRRQGVLEKFKDVANLNEKFDLIEKYADLLVRKVEGEFEKRAKMLSNGNVL